MTKILALDFGLQKIGVAVSDPTGTFAFARDRIANTTATTMPAIEKLIDQERISMVIIGRSSSPPVLTASEKLAKQLRSLGVPVQFYDESFTTQMAQSIPLAMGMKKKARQQFDDDSAAACVLLQSYLESQSV